MRAMMGVLLACSLAGCALQPQTREVRSYMPIIAKPDRPQLEPMTVDETAEFNKLPAPVKAKLIGNSDKLQIYATQYEAKLETYNEFAKSANLTSDAALGIAKPESVGGGK